MPRPNILIPALEPHQRELAVMIDDALHRGQRADGMSPKYWTPWTNRAFADKAAVSENAVANWRDPDRRMPPTDIRPLLKVFYGTIACYAEQSAQMLRLWRLARNYLTEDGPKQTHWNIGRPTNLQGTAQLVTLRAHEPLRGNDETLRLMLTLVITPDSDVTYRGQAITVGLTNALLSLQSDHWQPAWRSLVSERNHPNFAPDAAGARIVGPTDVETGMISGAPLGDEPFAMIEPIAGGGGPVQVAVHAPRGSFRVYAGGAHEPRKGVSRNQHLVLNALFHEQLRDRDDHDRAVLARVSVRPHPVPCP
jgi:hypothetical protein